MMLLQKIEEKIFLVMFLYVKLDALLLNLIKNIIELNVIVQLKQQLKNKFQLNNIIIFLKILMIKLIMNYLNVILFLKILKQIFIKI